MGHVSIAVKEGQVKQHKDKSPYLCQLIFLLKEAAT